MTEDVRETVCGGVQEYARAAFRFLAEEELAKLCPFFTLRLLAVDSVLLAEGEESGFMGFLLQGKLAVKKETTFAGKHVLLAILEPGTMVGEMSLVCQGPRNATVVATEESVLLELSRDAFDRFVAAEPAIGAKFLRRIVQVVSLRLRMADERLARLL